MIKAFWVNQGSSYSDERNAGLLWAPERTAGTSTVGGSKLVHWETMTEVEPGDVVFTYANSHLRGYAVASSAAVLMGRPYSVGTMYSPLQGGRAVFCNYYELQTPLPLATITSDISLRIELQSGTNPVFDVRCRVAQKYLCRISSKAAELLSKLVGLPFKAEHSIEMELTPTTVQRLAEARIGQGKFRDDLIYSFNGACAVTGLSVAPLLRASHIKPWTVSNNQERLDPENGVLLAAGVDAAFDRGYIGFDAGGALLSKPMFGSEERASLGIPVAHFVLNSTFLTQRRSEYLALHRLKFGF
jgi:putative restriction endonuclease